MYKSRDIVSAYLERPIRSLHDACQVRSRDSGLAQPPCHSCPVRDICEAGRARHLGYVILHPRPVVSPSHLAVQEIEGTVERTVAVG